MKFFHISDIHIGKLLHGYNMCEDQQYVLDIIVDRAKVIRPDAIVIAGDIYDKSVPSAEAVGIFDEFLTSLADIEPHIPVMLISGNHDSAERLDYASGILNKNDIHIAGMPPRTSEDYIKKIILTDKYGEVCFYLLPFVKPGYIRSMFDEPVESYNDAIIKLIGRENIDYSERNVLITHQFYTACGKEPDRCDSELITVGGVDNVDIQAVAGFDYVAMGHIHGRQKVGAEHIRYSGTPLKYSISEQHQKKGFDIVTLGQKGSVTTEFEEILPIRDVREIKGTLEEVIMAANDSNRNDYVSIVLTDNVDMYRPKDQLMDIYPNILEIRIDNDRVRSQLSDIDDVETIAEPLEVFEQFFQKMQERSMTDEEISIISEVINNAKEAQNL